MPIRAKTSTHFEPSDPNLQELTPNPRGPTVAPLLDVKSPHRGVGRRNRVVLPRSMPGLAMGAT
jgi:hypothetical protein